MLGVHVTNAKEAKETSVSQGSFYAWQAKLDHNARERARFGGTSHKTLYGAWGSSHDYKTLHKQTMIPGIIFASFFIADIKVGEMYFWGQASQLLCSVSQDICPDGKENTIDLENIKNFGRGHINLIPSSENLEWQKCLEYFYFSHCSSFPRFMTQERFTISQRGNCVTPDSH